MFLVLALRGATVRARWVRALLLKASETCPAGIGCIVMKYLKNDSPACEGRCVNKPTFLAATDNRNLTLAPLSLIVWPSAPIVRSQRPLSKVFDN